MSTLQHWDAKISQIDNTDYRVWNRAQMKEWLYHFERIPRVYVDGILDHVSNGKELSLLSRVELHALGLPWGICSHLAKGQEQLHQSVHGIFRPMFVQEAQPYAWPYNGNIR